MKKVIFLLLISFLLCFCNNMTDQKHPAGTDISLEWEFTGNNTSPQSHSAVFTLENTGHVKIVHVNGDLIRITPSTGFNLAPGQSIRIEYDKREWLIKENESPLGPYFVFTDSVGNELAVVPVQNYSIKPFPSLDKIFLPESSIPLPSAEWA